ncbi:unnamed protein product [Adineta ricciae]|uniref:RING-type domain-containing protein n=1 Tax=Adineta ricciae TaxID=249248 RepID=A0A815PR09_ADIRI|nr:unnamed protein product [Adineta ricciae]CAF1452909.1 unnamed protein product [Adineta ricciae]
MAEQQNALSSCPICFEDVQNISALSEQCGTCRQIYHRGCIISWLVTRHNNNQNLNCPNCRGSMDHIVQPLLEESVCAFCRNRITLSIQSLICRTCGAIYHKNELREVLQRLAEIHQLLRCVIDICQADLSWVLTEPIEGDEFGNTPIQPTELNVHIDNFEIFD